MSGFGVAASTHGDIVELRVIDRGPGHPAVTIARRFSRRSSAATITPPDSAGVGLGLAIARGFIESMRGTITLDDTPGGGLMAVVTLPTVAGRGALMTRVLVVDDEPHLVRALVLNLTARGYEVTPLTRLPSRLPRSAGCPRTCFSSISDCPICDGLEVIRD